MSQIACVESQFIVPGVIYAEGKLRHPHMNGFELSEKILAIDINVKICFMSSVEINREALREIYPTLGLGCFIRKPVGIDYLIKRIMSELD
jgi:two-component SAPR family response regulator